MGGRVRCSSLGEVEHISGEDGGIEEVVGAEWQESEGVDGEEKVEGNARW
jgi:hypothetical protein